MYNQLKPCGVRSFDTRVCVLDDAMPLPPYTTLVRKGGGPCFVVLGDAIDRGAFSFGLLLRPTIVCAVQQYYSSSTTRLPHTRVERHTYDSPTYFQQYRRVRVGHHHLFLGPFQ